METFEDRPVRLLAIAPEFKVGTMSQLMGMHTEQGVIGVPFLWVGFATETGFDHEALIGVAADCETTWVVELC